MPRPALIGLLAALTAGAALAQPAAPAIELSLPPCLPERDNGLVTATVEGVPEDAEVRLYFRRLEHGDFYYVRMVEEAEGAYWAVPPKPERRNETVELYVEVVRSPGGEEDKEVLARTELVTIPVTRDCDPALTDEQEDRGENLSIGDTLEAQVGKPVAWFLCDGIDLRIDPRGGERPERCRVVAWWVPTTTALGVTGIILIDDPEPVTIVQPGGGP